MKKIKKVKLPIDVLKDIICDSCGESCKTKDGSFEYMELHAEWGFNSKKDLEEWTAHICEKCVDERFKFIIFQKKELHPFIKKLNNER